MSVNMEELEVVLFEKYSSFQKEIFYMKAPGEDKVIIVSKNNADHSNIGYNLKKFFCEIFLPQGYPASVSRDYASYQIWDTAQAFCSTITGTLSTQAVMKGVGVGDTEATPLAATITWILKDGTGNVGRILFAWWKGSALDADSKKWRLAADILNDAALCLEVALPLFYGYTTYVLCISTAMKSIVCVAGGATRVALTQHQAIRENLADVSAKDGSQETAVNLIASVFAIFIISIIGQHIWPVFFIFTSLHLMSNYFAVSSVCINSFNSTRFLYCFNHFLNTDKVLDPEVTNKAEPVYFGSNINDRAQCGFKIKLGCSLKSLIEDNIIYVNDLQIPVNASLHEKYLLILDIDTKCIYIILRETVTSVDVIMAYYHAVLYGIIVSEINNYKTIILDEKYPKDTLLHNCKKLSNKYKSSDGIFESKRLQLTQQLYELVNVILKDSWTKFKQQAEEAGWNLEKNLLICDEWRGDWKKKQD